MPADVYALIEAKRPAILAVADRYGITNVRVFGSVARREAREDSDLDLLVTFGPTATLFDLVGFERDLRDSSASASRSPPTAGSGIGSARPSCRKRCRCEARPRPARGHPRGHREDPGATAGNGRRS